MEFQPNTSSWLSENNGTFKTPSDESYIKKNKRKIKMPIVYCTKCKTLIKEKHLFRIGDNFWHKACVLCDNCTGQLNDNGYLVDNKLLCQTCYYKSTHAPKCFGCNKHLLSNDFAMYSLNNPYHLACFKCFICGTLISKGDRYMVNNGQLICKQDYEASRAASSAQPRPQTATLNSVKYNTNHPIINPGAAINMNMSNNHNGVRKKTKISPDQRIYLERYYSKNPNPTIKQRELIAKELDLQPKVIQTWFCNYRTKLKLQKSNGNRSVRDRSYSDDQESSSSNRIKSMRHDPCLTPDQDYPTTNCQISQSTEDHASPQDLSSDMSATGVNGVHSTYNCPTIPNDVLNHQKLVGVPPNIILSQNNGITSTVPPPTQASQHSYTHQYQNANHSTNLNNDSNNEITLTELSNSCAKSIEQSLLAGFSVISEQNNSNSSHTVPMIPSTTSVVD